MRLMGGVSDDTCDSQCRGACAAGDGRDSVEQAEVRDDCVDCDILGSDARGHAVGRDFHELGVSDGGTANDSPADFRGRTGCDVVHLDGLVAYDVLWNERQKAVWALRRWKPEEAIDNDHCGEIQIRLLYQLLDLGGAMMMDGADAAKKVRDHLIHLLGGDKPSGIDAMNSYEQRIEKLEKQRDHWRELADTNTNALLRIGSENVSLKAECKRLRKRLDSITEAIERIKSVGQE
jgi:hypothetical protein